MVETLGKGIVTGTTLGKEIGAGGAVTPGPAGTTGMTVKRTGAGAPDKARKNLWRRREHRVVCK